MSALALLCGGQNHYNYIAHFRNRRAIRALAIILRRNGIHRDILAEIASYFITQTYIFGIKGTIKYSDLLYRNLRLRWNGTDSRLFELTGQITGDIVPIEISRAKYGNDMRVPLDGVVINGVGVDRYYPKSLLDIHKLYVDSKTAELKWFVIKTSDFERLYFVANIQA